MKDFSFQKSYFRCRENIYICRPLRRLRRLAIEYVKKHIGGEASDFRPKAGNCAFSCNHPRPNMADQDCNLGNDSSSKPLPLTSFKSITA